LLRPNSGSVFIKNIDCQLQNIYNHNWNVKIWVMYTDDTDYLVAQGTDGTYQINIDEEKSPSVGLLFIYSKFY